MATNEERLAASAAWLRANKDKTGTPEFDRVAHVYKTLRTAPVTQPAPEQQQGQVQPEQPETTAKSLASNFAGGAVDATLTLPGAVNDLMLMGVDKLAQQFGAKPLTPEQYADNPFGSETVRGMLKDYVSPDIFGPEAKTTTERYARRVGEFVGPGAALAPAKMIRPVLTASVTGGLGSRVAQDMFPDSPYAPLVGGLLGGFAPAAAGAARSLRVPTGGLSDDSAQLAKQMIDEGIPILPGQVGSKSTRILYDAVSKLPFMGTKARTEQLRAFNAAIARTMGEQADTLTPTVMGRAKARIGNMFNQVFARNNIQVDKNLVDDLADIQVRVAENLTDAQIPALTKALNLILSEANKTGGVLSGRKYHAFNSKGGVLDNLIKSSDPNIKFYAGQIREAIDDAFTRSASVDDAAMLKTAKQQYRSMKVIQDLVSKAEDGNISPALLLGRVMANDKSMAYTGGGKLGMLAKGGQRFLKEVPGSQTAERTAIYGALGAVGGGAGLMAPQAIVPAAAVFAGAKGIKAILESKRLGVRMVGQALKRAAANANKFDPALAARQAGRGVAPGAIGVAGRGASLERVPSSNRASKAPSR